MDRRTRPAAIDSVARNPIRSALLAGALLGGALLLWLGFSPASVGGNFSYVLIQGDSMAPTVNHGDGNRGEKPLAPLEVTLTKRQWLTLRVPLVAREPQSTV